MTSVFDDAGDNIPCTVILAGPNVVSQVKTADGPDGYDALQLAFDEKREKSARRSEVGHFGAAGTTPRRKVVEFGGFGDEYAPGDEINVDDLFVQGELIDVAAITKGKGFQGVVKRHGFRGVGSRTHGQHNRERAPGSIGASSDPSRVFKGMRMAGRQGGTRVTIKNLAVVRLIPDRNVILVKGAVPGPKGGYVELLKKG